MHSLEGVLLPSVPEMLETERRVLMLMVLLVLESSRLPRRSVLFVMAAVGYHAAPKMLGVFALAVAQALAAPVRHYSLEVSLPLPVAWWSGLPQYEMFQQHMLMVEQLGADLLSHCHHFHDLVFSLPYLGRWALRLRIS